MPSGIPAPTFSFAGQAGQACCQASKGLPAHTSSSAAVRKKARVRAACEPTALWHSCRRLSAFTVWVAGKAAQHAGADATGMAPTQTSTPCCAAERDRLQYTPPRPPRTHCVAQAIHHHQRLRLGGVHPAPHSADPGDCVPVFHGHTPCAGAAVVTLR